MFGKKNKTATITKKQEENIISTICGDTTSFQRTVNAEWVALASSVHDVNKVDTIVKKYGGKIVNGEIKLDSLRSTGKIGVAYAEIRKKRAQALEDYYRKRDIERKKKAKAQAKRKMK